MSLQFKLFLKRYPLFLPLGGILNGIYLAIYLENFLNIILILFLISASVIFLFLKKKTSYWFWQFSFTFLFLVWGSFFTQKALYQPLPKVAELWTEQAEEVPVLLVAQDYCRKSGRLHGFQARLLGYELEGAFRPLKLGLQVRVKRGPCVVKPHQVYRTIIKLSQPKRFKNPSSFDYPFYLKTQGVDLLAYVSSQDNLQPQKKAVGFLREISFSIRQKISDWLDKNLEDTPQTKGLFHALLLRNKGELPELIKEDFKECGLAHLLVISGLHLSWVFLFFYFPLYFILNFKRKWANRAWAKLIATFLTFIPLSFYILIIGETPPVLRSALMLFLGSLIWALGSRKDFFSLIFFTAFALLMIHPVYAFDLSFQLSFLSLTLLYLSGKYLYTKFGEKFCTQRSVGRKIFYTLISILFSTWALNIILLPLTAHYFHSYSAIAPLANLVILPVFIGLLMPGLFITLLLFSFNEAWGNIALGLMSELSQWVLWLVEKLSQFPGAAWQLVSLSWPHILMVSLISIACFQLHAWKRCLVLLSLAFCILGLDSIAKRFFISHSFKMTLIDVGQGESILLQLPKGKNILIDGGGPAYGDFNLGKKVLVPELLSLGVRELETVYLTHADADHYRGLIAVLESFPVKKFCSSIDIGSYPELKVLTKLINEKKISTCLLQAQQRWQINQVNFEVLWPPNNAVQLDQTLKNRPKDNFTSLVMKVCHQEFCFLFTGDIEEDVERDLLAQRASLKATVLKLAHHGSRTSSSLAFLQAVDPKFAIVSAGYKNRFKHPHPQVLQRFQKMEVSLLRTDLEGQIQITIKNKKLNYQTFSGLEAEF